MGKLLAFLLGDIISLQKRELKVLLLSTVASLLITITVVSVKADTLQSAAKSSQELVMSKLDDIAHRLGRIEDHLDNQDLNIHK